MAVSIRFSSIDETHPLRRGVGDTGIPAQAARASKRGKILPKLMSDDPHNAALTSQRHMSERRAPGAELAFFFLIAAFAALAYVAVSIINYFLIAM